MRAQKARAAAGSLRPTRCGDGAHVITCKDTSTATRKQDTESGWQGNALSLEDPLHDLAGEAHTLQQVPDAMFADAVPKEMLHVVLELVNVRNSQGDHGDSGSRAYAATTTTRDHLHCAASSLATPHAATGGRSAQLT